MRCADIQKGPEDGDCQVSVAIVKPDDSADVRRAVELFLIGGKGPAALLLHRLTRAGVDPLSPDNVVVINTGPLNGTGTPG